MKLSVANSDQAQERPVRGVTRDLSSMKQTSDSGRGWREQGLGGGWAQSEARLTGLPVLQVTQRNAFVSRMQVNLRHPKTPKGKRQDSGLFRGGQMENSGGSGPGQTKSTLPPPPPRPSCPRGCQ